MVVDSGEELHFLAVQFAADDLCDAAVVLHLDADEDIHGLSFVLDSISHYLGERAAADLTDSRGAAFGGLELDFSGAVPEGDASESDRAAYQILIAARAFFRLLLACRVPEVFGQFHLLAALGVDVDGSAVVEIDAEGAVGVLHRWAVVSDEVVLDGLL